MAEVKADLTEMYKLMRLLRTDYTVRIGILGSKATTVHENSKLTNAEIGTYHEFGSKDGKHPPQRSFLMMPIGQKLNFNQEEMKNMRKVLFKQLFIKKAPQEFYKALISRALEVVENAFATGGYGEWKPLADRTYARREKKAKLNPKKATKKSLTYWFNHPILTDTGQLRRSISGKIIKGQ